MILEPLGEHVVDVAAYLYNHGTTADVHDAGKLLNSLRCRREIVITDPPFLSPAQLAADEGISETQKYGLRGLLEMWWAMQQVRGIKRKFETQDKAAYDCVIWARPDLVYLTPIETTPRAVELAYPPCNWNFGHPDHFSYGTSMAMDARMGLFDFYFHVYRPAWIRGNIKTHNGKWTAEIMQAAAVTSAGLKPRLTQAVPMRVCYDKGSTLVRLPTWNSPPELAGELSASPVMQEAMQFTQPMWERGRRWHLPHFRKAIRSFRPWREARIDIG